jgi:hypothetical protein
MRTTWIASVVVVLATAATAEARTGLELAGGLQAGEISCRSEGDDCNGFTAAGGLALDTAYMLGPRFGLALDLWGMSHRKSDFTFSHYVNTLGVKVRPVQFLTLSAGLGAAHASVDYHGRFADSRVTSDTAFAIMTAAAVDVLRSQRWALSVELRFGTGFYGKDDDERTEDIVGRNVGLGAAFTVFGF